jgi:plasmid replication initiation protein
MSAINKKEFLLFQPNTLTSARYNYSAVAKNVIYTMIDLLQRYQTHEKEPQRDLFQNIEITLNIAAIAKGNNSTYVWSVISNEIMKRPIEYTYVDPADGKTVQVSTVLIPTMRMKRGSGEITVKLIPESIDVLLFLGKGFTAYRKTIAFSLPSVYSKRLYELCCRYGDTGIYRVTIDEFRQMMNCEGKFKQIVELRRCVVEQAIKDINELSELYVSYQFVKGKRIGKTPAKVEYVIFFITKKTADREYYVDAYKIVFNVLSGIYGDSTAMCVADWFLDNKRIVAACERLDEIRENIKNGTIAKHGAHNYVLTILKNFNVPPELLPEPTKKKPAKRKK